MKVITRISPSIIATVEVINGTATENDIANVVDRTVRLSDAEASQWAYQLCNEGDTSDWYMHVADALSDKLGIEADVTFSYSPEEA